MKRSEWIKGYQEALARTLVRLGDPVEQDWKKRTYGSMSSYALSKQVHAHLEEDDVWALTSDPTEEVWSEFAGTFASTAESTRKGFKAQVSCSCGKYQNMEIMVETSFPDLLMALLREGA